MLNLSIPHSKEVADSYFLPEGVPKVGEYWPGQGGIYAGIIPDYQGYQSRHLVVSVDEAVNVDWGGPKEHELDARSRDDGHANTWALSVCGHSHPAAEWAYDYTKDGHSDFHLPSRRELQIAASAIPDKFAPDWYWSSTEHSWPTALGRSFARDETYIDIKSKDELGRARAFRTIPVAATDK